MHAQPRSYASAGASSGGSSLVGSSLAKETTKPPPVRLVYILTFFASAASRAFSACSKQVSQ